MYRSISAFTLGHTVHINITVRNPAGRVIADRQLTRTQGDPRIEILADALWTLAKENPNAEIRPWLSQCVGYVFEQRRSDLPSSWCRHGLPPGSCRTCHPRPKCEHNLPAGCCLVCDSRRRESQDVLPC